MRKTVDFGDFAYDTQNLRFWCIKYNIKWLKLRKTSVFAVGRKSSNFER